MNPIVEKFDARHGAFVVDNETMFFENGATRERVLNGFMHEPPEDETQRLENIKKFLSIKLQLSVTKFYHTKKLFLAEVRGAVSMPGNPGGTRRDVDVASKELNNLKDIANEYKIELEKIDKRLTELRTQQKIPQKEKMEIENRAAHAAFIDEISKIQI